MAQKALRVRRSLLEIQNDFTSGKDTATLENLMVAWQFIKALPPTDPNSFFSLGGYHGEPFRGRGEYDAALYWGGYCNHGNILFPTWHRVYLYKLEKALQSVPGCENLMLPYWDQTYKTMTKDGLTFADIPSCLTDEYFTFSKTGVKIPNPLKSFTFPVELKDAVEVNQYTKPKGYETVRYPLSGLVGTAQDLMTTEQHNSAYYIAGTNIFDNTLTTSLLNQNVKGWLTGVDVLPITRGGIDANYHTALDAPNYTVFSNSTAQKFWNKQPENKDNQVIAVETPHGEIHLSVGGFDVPGANLSQIADANGDMGENETAGLDPIFFFHHCNVDRVFWAWQVKHKSTDKLDIITKKADGTPYPGTNNNDGQGAPVGYEPETALTMESPLYPFKKIDNGEERIFRSSDCFNIEKQMGFTYESLSLDNTDGAPETLKALTTLAKTTPPKPKSDSVLIVSGIDRSKINGSFVIMAYATIDGVRYFLGSDSVLSRWKVAACANCVTHLEVSSTFSLNQFTPAQLKDATFDIQISGRRGNEAQFAKFDVANSTRATNAAPVKKAGALSKLVSVFSSHKVEEKPFNLEVV